MRMTTKNPLFLIGKSGFFRLRLFFLLLFQPEGQDQQRGSRRDRDREERGAVLFRRRRLLRLRDKVVAEETEKYEELKNELKRKGIL